MHSARWRSSRSAASSASAARSLRLGVSVPGTGGDRLGFCEVRHAPIIRESGRTSLRRGTSGVSSFWPMTDLICDGTSRATAYRRRRSASAGLWRPSATRHAVTMFTRSFSQHLLAGLRQPRRPARASRRAGGAPALPQVTAAAALARDVTEWDEFTGRLEPVQSVGVRPRVSGLISTVLRGRQPRASGTAALPDRRPSVPGARSSGCAPSWPRRRRPPTAPRPSCSAPTGCQADNAMSLEERERRAGAAAEATAHVDAVAAALRAAELDLEFTRVVVADRRPRRAARSSRAAISCRAARARRRC